jgi:hypothetical protein
VLALNSYRQWWIKPRISSLVVAAQNAQVEALERLRKDQEVALRSEIASAERRAAAAEGKAATAQAAADSARASRQAPAGSAVSGTSQCSRTLTG